MIMGCCGSNKKTSAQLEYRVTLSNGTVETVATIAEARLKLATGGGGTYKAVPKAAAK